MMLPVVAALSALVLTAQPASQVPALATPTPSQISAADTPARAPGAAVTPAADSITLATDTTVISLAVKGAQVRLTSLKNRAADGWDYIAKGTDPQPVPLPVPAGSSGARWQYQGMTVDRSSGTKATLRFTSTTPGAELQLESVWWARTGPGPVENWIVVQNTGSNVVTWAARAPAPPPGDYDCPGMTVLNNTWVIGADYDAFSPATGNVSLCAERCCAEQRCIAFGFDEPGAVGRGPVGNCSATKYCCWLKDKQPQFAKPPKPGFAVWGGRNPKRSPRLAGIDISVVTHAPAVLHRFSKTSAGMPVMESFPLAASNNHSTTTIHTPCSENQYIPLIMLDVSNGSRHQHGLYIGYEWELGSIDVTASSASDDEAHRLKLSVSPLDATLLQPPVAVAGAGHGGAQQGQKQESFNFTVPSVYYGAYSGSLDDGSNELKQWFWQHKVPHSLRNNQNEPWTEICYGIGHGGRNGLSCGCALPQSWYDAAAASGVEAVKQDFGWYGNATTDLSSRNWQYRPKDWPAGFNFAKNAHKAGMNASLYMGGSYNDMNLSTSAGRDAEFEAVAQRFDEDWFDMWRTDTYTAPENPIPSSYHGVTNFYWLMDKLIATRPGFRYENCANGGRFKAFSTARRMTFMTTNDIDGGGPPPTTAGVYYRASVWVAGYALNSIQLKSDVGLHPPHPVAYMARTSMLGAWQLCGIEPNNTVYRQHIQLYKTKQRPILRGGGMYHILPKPDGINWDGFQFFHRGLKKGSIFLFKPASLNSTVPPVPDELTIRLSGLAPTARYRLTFQDRPAQNGVQTGAALMGEGLRVAGLRGTFASEIVWISQLID